jgi:hypothetical protein
MKSQTLRETSSTRRQGNVLHVEIHLSKFWSRASVIEPSLIKQIDKAAHEKKAYLAYLAFRALLFGNSGSTTSVRSRDKFGTLPVTSMSGSERSLFPTPEGSGRSASYHFLSGEVRPSGGTPRDVGE